MIGVVLLLGLLPLAPLLPPVGLLGLSAAVLVGIAAADTARAHGRPLERPASPL